MVQLIISTFSVLEYLICDNKLCISRGEVRLRQAVEDCHTGVAKGEQFGMWEQDSVFSSQSPFLS